MRNTIADRGHSVGYVTLRRSIPIVLGALLLIFAGAAGAEEYSPPKPDRDELLARLSTETRYAIRGLQYILSNDELEDLVSQRHEYLIRRWIEDYWQSNDPIYTTPENECRIEHERRVAYAEEHFDIPVWPMWDQRGEIYIRYGRPTYRQVIPAEVSATGISPPGELWYYQQYDMFVLFEDAAASGEYTYYLERVKGPPGIRMEKIYAGIDQVSENLGVIAPPSISYETAYDNYKKMLFKLDEVMESAPASYWFNLDEHRLPFVFSIDTFRDGTDSTRVDFNIEFRADLSWRDRPPVANEYHATVVLWNSDHAEIKRTEQRLTIPLVPGSSDSTRLMPTQLVLSVPPGFYFAALTLQESPSGRIGSYRKNLTCNDYNTAPAISDILLASRIVPSSRPSLFNRNGLEVIPHPMRRYRHPFSIPIYFELYNLETDGRGVCSYDVSYRIVSKTPRKVGFWGRLRGKKSKLDVTSSFVSSRPGSTDRVHITLGTENLWPGTFTLEIAVTDLRCDRTVSRTLDFELIE